MNPSSSEKPVLDYSNLTRPRFDQGAMRAGQFLVVSSNTTLAPRCIYCNAPSFGPSLIQKFTTAKTFTLVTFSVMPPTVALRYFLCIRHRRRFAGLKFATGATAVLTFLMAISILILKIQEHWDSTDETIRTPLIILCPLFMGLAVLLGTDAQRGPRHHHTEHDHVYLSGISKSFLEQLPSLPGHS